MAKFLIFILIATGSANARDLDKLYTKAKFELSGHVIELYLADNEARREQGLMFVEKMPENVGMLFVFDHTQELSFWMKNTLIPLNIGFFDENGVLVDVQEMKVAKSLMDLEPPTYQSRAPGAFALEMNTGWFAKHNVKTGARLTLISKSASPVVVQRLQKKKTSRP